MKPFYLTTTLPYVNADPHIGFALELVQADIIARFKQLQGVEVFFNTGTDEHGQKIYQKAVEQGINTQKYVDDYATKFKSLIKVLDVATDVPGITFNFIRTTDAHHEAAAQEFWLRVKKNGFIYKKNYQINYCVGCELEKTESELVDGHCPLHPNLEIEIINEENYFFKFSAFGDKLLALYDANPDFVVPDFRINEMRALIARGLENFSISRLKAKMSWGVGVPDDPDHVMYVWFDALVSYISAIGWPDDTKKFETYWPVVQYAGKDNLRQQSAMWQAMLMAADLPPSKQIIIHGFITSGGQKMSKSLGNVVNPFDIIAEYGTDALRYYLAREIHPFEDSDFTMEKFKATYNANLANGLGNLVSRIMKLSETYLTSPVASYDKAIPKEIEQALALFNVNAVVNFVWGLISHVDQVIQADEPFKVVKTDKEKGQNMIQNLVSQLGLIAHLLSPILPETAEHIKTCIKENKMPSKSLFLRKE